MIAKLRQPPRCPAEEKGKHLFSHVLYLEKIGCCRRHKAPQKPKQTASSVSPHCFTARQMTSCSFTFVFACHHGEVTVSPRFDIVLWINEIYYRALSLWITLRALRPYREKKKKKKSTPTNRIDHGAVLRTHDGGDGVQRGYPHVACEPAVTRPRLNRANCTTSAAFTDALK